MEFFSNQVIRLELSAKYSWQIMSADDLELDATIPALDVDMSGLRATVGLSFMFGD